MIKRLWILLIFSFFSNCEMNNDEEGNVARFEDSYLSKNDFLKLMKDYSEEDSLVKANYIVNNWAINQILLQRARLNLSDDKLNSINSLVEQYRDGLLSDSYLEALVNSSINLELDTLEIETLFSDNKKLFLLNQDIFKLVFIELPLDFSDTYDIRRRLKRFKENDKKFLDSVSYRYNRYSFDSKSWISEKKLLNDFPFLTSYSFRSLKNYNFYQFKDSLGLYLIKIVDSAKKGEISPIEYVAPTLEYMSLNKRKKELMLTIKSDILKDALLYNKLEIY